MRKEVVEKISFTPKETDIYKIHQSGDLANLDGLDKDSLKQLPALFELRNAMYSQEFRRYLSGITDSGPLSGKKTDMAINIYTPGSHLLCHDDVIGSRRVSYILYLTDPENPWQEDWGGALRLYPTRTIKQVKGPKYKVPDPDASLSIPPAWNQLSYFAVQPGESFHDVEEVYSSGDVKLDAGRVRLAISGWYHIPQVGEEGYKEGLEQELATSSSLTQLQTKDDLDLPKTQPTPYAVYTKGSDSGQTEPKQDQDEDSLSDTEIDFLLQFMAPRFLTPDAVEELKNTFQDVSCIRIDGFLSTKFADALRAEIANEPHTYGSSSKNIEESSSWTVARPPHKHRFLFMLPNSTNSGKENKPDLLAKETTATSSIKQLLNTYLSSLELRKWLRLSTGLVLRTHDIKARRFRRGQDYQLATSYDEDNPRLEMTLGITPDGQWEAEEEVEKEASKEEKVQTKGAEGEVEKKEEKEKEVGKGDTEEKEVEEREAEEEKVEREAKEPEKAKDKDPPQEINNGGYEVWMAGDDDDNDNTQTTTAVDTSQETITSSGSTAVEPETSTTLPSTKSQPEPKPSTSADPAIYQSTSAAPDDGILFSMPAGWNRMSLVLRDSGTLRFVKYVSRSAGADRWDVVCDWEIDWDATPEFEEGDGEEVEEEIGEEELARELEEEEEEQQRRMRRSTSEETTEEEPWGGIDSEEDEDDDGDGEEQENVGPAVGGKKKAASQAGRFGKRRM